MANERPSPSFEFDVDRSKLLFVQLANTLVTHGRRVSVVGSKDEVIHRLSDMPLLDAHNIKEISFTPAYILESDTTQDGIFIDFEDGGLAKHITLYRNLDGSVSSVRDIGITIGKPMYEISPEQASEVTKAFLSGTLDSDDPAVMRRLEQMAMDADLALQGITPEEEMELQDLSRELKEYFAGR